MFIIKHNDQVVLGPMKWNKYRFEAVLLEDHEITAVLDQTNEPETMVTVDANTTIYPVAGTPDPVFNPKTEFLHGPFYTYTNGIAYSSYTVEPLTLEAIRSNLNYAITLERYTHEIKGVKVTIQAQEVTVDTSREGRNIFVQALLLMPANSTLNWKFPEGWLTLTNAELGAAVQAGVTHVQAAFDWEAAKLTEIASTTTAAELDAVVLIKAA